MSQTCASTIIAAPTSKTTGLGSLDLSLGCALQLIQSLATAILGCLQAQIGRARRDGVATAEGAVVVINVGSSDGCLGVMLVSEILLCLCDFLA